MYANIIFFVFVPPQTCLVFLKLLLWKLFIENVAAATFPNQTCLKPWQGKGVTLCLPLFKRIARIFEFEGSLAKSTNLKPGPEESPFLFNVFQPFGVTNNNTKNGQIRLVFADLKIFQTHENGLHAVMLVLLTNNPNSQRHKTQEAVSH